MYDIRLVAGILRVLDYEVEHRRYSELPAQVRQEQLAAARDLRSRLVSVGPDRTFTPDERSLLRSLATAIQVDEESPAFEGLRPEVKHAAKIRNGIARQLLASLDEVPQQAAS